MIVVVNLDSTGLLDGTAADSLVAFLADMPIIGVANRSPQARSAAMTLLADQYGLRPELTIFSLDTAFWQIALRLSVFPRFGDPSEHEYIVIDDMEESALEVDGLSVIRSREVKSSPPKSGVTPRDAVAFVLVSEAISAVVIERFGSRTPVLCCRQRRAFIYRFTPTELNVLDALFEGLHRAPTVVDGLDVEVWEYVASERSSQNV